jgi:hypothetical protein
MREAEKVQQQTLQWLAKWGASPFRDTSEKGRIAVLKKQRETLPLSY